MTKRKIIWGGLGLIAVAVRWLSAGHPEWTEYWYSRGLFLVIRSVIDYGFAWFPLPIFYLVLIGGVGVLGYRGIRFFRRSAPWPKKLAEAGWSLAAFTGGGVFLFLFLWGFNYGRLPIEQQLGLHPEPLSLKELKSEFDLETEKIIELRKRIPGAGDSALTFADLPPDLEGELRQSLRRWLNDHHFPGSGRVRARVLLPAGIYLRFGSSGMYFPFSGEGTIDAGVHPLQRPFVMAHEMGHGYGFGDEGTCNFLAYLTCNQSEDPLIAYAGHLDYWRTLAVNYRRYQPETYQSIREQLPPGIQADLDAINQSLLRYPDFFPKIRYYAYDAYLKTQGIKEGMLNYNRVVMLVYAWRKAREM